MERRGPRMVSRERRPPASAGSSYDTRPSLGWLENSVDVREACASDGAQQAARTVAQTKGGLRPGVHFDHKQWRVCLPSCRTSFTVGVCSLLLRVMRRQGHTSWLERFEPAVEKLLERPPSDEPAAEPAGAAADGLHDSPVCRR